MNTLELRKKYFENNSKIKKFEKLLDNISSNKFLIKKSISDIEKNQNELSKEIRKNIYKSFESKDIEDKQNNELEIKVEYSVTDVEEKKNLNFIDETPTEVLKFKSNNSNNELSQTNYDDKTDVLKTKDDDKTDVLKSNNRNFKVLFDGKYKLMDEYNNVVCEKNINNILLDHNYSQNMPSFNFDIINFLEEYNPNLKRKYITSNISITYDFTKVKITKENAESIRKLKKIAKLESKAFKNVSYKDNSVKKIISRGLIIASAIGILLGGKSVIKNSNISNSKTNNSYSTTTIDENEEDLNINKINNTKKEITTQEKTTESAVIKENKDNDIVSSKNTATDNKTEVKTENKIDEEVKDESIKIGDVVYLNSVDLYYASTDDAPNGNTEHLGDKLQYKVNMISIVYKNQVIDRIYDNSVDIYKLSESCKEKYGEDVKVCFNSDPIDKDGNIISKNVGWVNSEQEENAIIKVLK